MSIRFEKVDHIYSENTPFAYQALSDVDLDISEGKITAVIGATGSGKTTLVQHLNGLLLPSKGIVEVNDVTIRAGEKVKDIKHLRSQVGLVFQFAEYQLFEETLIKDVAFGPQNFGMEVTQAEKLAKEALKTCGISEADFDKSPLELSGGQKRRVAIAGIIAMQPQVLVLDEPTAGLDPQGAKMMMDLFAQLNRQRHITIIIVTHNMEHVLSYCDEVVVMENGKMIMHCDKNKFFENEQYMQKALIDPPVIISFKKLCAEKGVQFSADVLDIKTLADKIAKRCVNE
ncbi:MAG: energy-coupling factor transporter ATPase [Erysipelotrichia bacterium]|nr:energy-coupling factor transporter ATPase [Erysipelotrichia bacterium]